MSKQQNSDQNDVPYQFAERVLTVSLPTAFMLIPGVAFDPACHRVGYGQGFYDRYLEAHVQHPTVALAFDFQIKEAVPFEETDICPQMVLTETTEYRYDRKGK